LPTTKEICQSEHWVRTLCQTMSKRDCTPIAYRLLNQYGQVFSQVHKLKAQNNQLCYMNAYQLMSRSDLIYVEGFAYQIIPTMHAWCVDKKGGIHDPTWGTKSSDYFGVKFKVDFVYEVAMKTKIYGILDSLYMLKMSPEKVYDYLKEGLIL
jgi:hypothetical protein